MKTFKSSISNNLFDEKEKVVAKNINSSIYKLIEKDHPTFNETSEISKQELNIYRQKYISNCLQNDFLEQTELKTKLKTAYNNEELLTDKLENDEASPQTFGQRVADKVASFGGSWTFIISFGVFLLIWICTNVFILCNKAFDPYPFILLNLILSCIAAMQAPIIMMSQNRQEEKDRERGKKDYLINLKSELEIRELHEKMDHLILNQHQELFQIQKEQMNILSDIWEKLEKNK